MKIKLKQYVLLPLIILMILLVSCTFNKNEKKLESNSLFRKHDSLTREIKKGLEEQDSLMNSLDSSLQINDILMDAYEKVELDTFNLKEYEF